MTKELERKVKAMLKAESKEKVLSVWNRFYRDWVGYGDAEFLTKQQLLDEWKVNSAELTREKAWNRDLAMWNSKKKYVVKWGDGVVISEGRFFSKDFVDIDNEDFLEIVYAHFFEFGLNWWNSGLYEEKEIARVVNEFYFPD